MDSEILYPPRTNSGWDVWGGDVCPIFISDAASLGLTPALATGAQTAYTAYHAAFLAAAAPSTRSRVTIQGRRDALAAFRAAVKPIVAIIQSNPNVTNEQRVQLGLRVRDNVPSPAPPIGFAPSVQAMLTGPTSVRVIADNPLDPDRRAKPPHVMQIAVHTYLTTPGTTAKPPTDKTQWPLYLLSGKKTIDLFWPGMASANTVWVCCRYVNTRNVPGPFSPAVTVTLPGTGLSPVPPAEEADGGAESMSIAA